MSMKVLLALVGEEEFEKLSPEDVRQLCDAIDDEILRDGDLTARLLSVLRSTIK